MHIPLYFGEACLSKESITVDYYLELNLLLDILIIKENITWIVSKGPQANIK